MPMGYAIDENSKLVVAKHVGVTTDEELVSGYTAVFEDEAYDLGFNKLIDLREAVSGERSASALMMIRNLVELHYAGSDQKFKLALLAPNDVSYGMSRMYGLLSEDTNQDIKVFRDLRSAAQWLELRPELLTEITEGIEV